VGLISRVISVLIGAPLLGTFFLVMLVAGPTVLFAVSSLPTIIPGMAGIHLSPRNEMIFSIILMVQVVSQLSVIPWLLAGVIAFFMIPAKWQPSALDAGQAPRRHGWLSYFAVAAVLFWMPLLPMTQREQHLRLVVESDMRSGQIAEGLAAMSAQKLEDFPPHWDPPPQQVYDDNGMILDVMEVVLDRPPAPWVRKLYFDKFAIALEDDQMLARFGDQRFVNILWPRTERLLARLSNESAFLTENKEWIDSLEAWSRESNSAAPTTAPASTPTTAAAPQP
jgi:hypothetical protein